MERTFMQALEHRRTYYSIADESPISDSEIQEIINFAVTHVPSAFNSQSTRVVLLLGEQHRRLWEITKDELKKIVPANDFGKTEEKINNAFQCGYGTILFFEDQSVVKGLQDAFPLYKDNFPIWSTQTSAMHQLAIWVMLEDAGLGASLQHYNPLINQEVLKNWNLPEQWLLVAQMPFGKPVEKPGQKNYQPLEDRIKVFR